MQFPKWTDGRAYSPAVLLRTGFDSAILRADQNPATAERALGFFDGH